jgi:hypothetical protein
MYNWQGTESLKTKPKQAAQSGVSRKAKRPARSRNGFSSQEFRYLVDHAAELEQHRGEWLLIDGYGLAAHSSDFGVIKAVIAQRGIRSPFVHYVPVEDESVFLNA